MNLNRIYDRDISGILRIGAFLALVVLMIALGGHIVSDTNIATVTPTAPNSIFEHQPDSIDLDEFDRALCYRECSLIR